MGIVFGSQVALAAAAQRSFRNISSSEVNFTAGGLAYSLDVNETQTLYADDAAQSISLAALITGGQVVELSVYGAKKTPTPLAPVSSDTSAPAPISFTAATASSITGNFDGMGIDPISGRWVLADGNRLVYPNSRSRTQPAAGPTSAVTLGATMQRTSTAGSIGFALYTDAPISAHNFANGIVVHYESTGLCEIYRLQGGLWSCVTGRPTQLPYRLDLNEHTFAVVVQYPDAGHLRVIAYADGIAISQATFTSGVVTNGTIGFSTAGGAAPALIVPNSFVFDLGTDVYETTSAVTRQLIGNNNGTASLAIPQQVSGVLGQANSDPAMVQGSVTGTNRNMVLDSDYKFGENYCNSGTATGAMVVLAGVGASGGKGVVLPAGPGGGLTGIAYLPFYAIGPVSTGSQWTISGNILATSTLSGGTGLPAWEVWDGGFTTRIAHADQQLGLPVNPTDKTRRVQQTFNVPAGVTSLVVTPASNNVELAAGGQIVWSEPKLETGPYATAYSTGLFDDSSQKLPLAISAGELQSIVTADGLGGGLVNLAKSNPSQPAPYIVMPGQFLSTVSDTLNAQNTFLKGQTVANNSVLPGAITQSSTTQAVYDSGGATPNTFNNAPSNYYWYLVGTGPITNSTVIPDGSTLVYSVAQTDPAATPSPTIEALQLAANATISIVWSHPAYVGTSIGSTRVSFTGAQSGSTSNIQASASLSDASSPNITGAQSSQTTTPPYSAALTNSGNPSITSGPVSNITQTANSRAVADAQSTGINGANNTVTANQPSTAAVNQSSTPQVQRIDTPHTDVTPESAAHSAASTPTITSASSTGPQLTPVAGGGSDSSSPTITATGSGFTSTTPRTGSTATYTGTTSVSQNSSTSYSNQSRSGTATAGSGTATIVASPYTVTTLNQHDSGYLNGGSGSTGTINTNTNYAANSPSWGLGLFDVGIMTDTTSVSDNAGCTSDTLSFQPTLNSSITGHQRFMDANTVCDGSHPISLDVALPSSFSVTVGTAGATERARNSGGTIIYSCAAINNQHSIAYSISWNVSLLAPNGSLVQSWTGVTGTTTLSSTSGGGVVGAYSWVVTPQYVSDTGAAGTPDGSVQVSGGTATLHYSDVTTTYTPAAGSFVLLGQFTGNVAPTTPGTQLNFHVANTSLPSDAHGSSGVEIVVQKADGSGTWVIDVSNPANNSDHVYYAAGETCKSYYAWYRTIINSNNNNGASSYAANVDGHYFYYNNDNSTAYNYSTTNGATSSIATSAAALVGAAGTPISCTFTGVSVPGDAYGTSYINVSLLNPAGTIVQSWTVTSNQTLTYTGGNGGTGTWTWQFTPIAVRSGAPTTNINYTDSWTAQTSWYESIGTTTYSYSTADGPVATYTSDASTQAPTSGSVQLSLDLTNCTFPSDANGNSYVTVVLKNPSGTVLTHAYNAHYNSTTGTNAGAVAFAGATTFTYSAAGAPAGAYTWTVQAHTNSTNTGSSSYAVSFNATPAAYQTSSGTNYTYAHADGASTSFSTAGGTLAPTSPTTQLTLSLSSLVMPSDSEGTVNYRVDLLNPAASVVQTWSIASGQTSANIAYSAPGAAAGVWVWHVYAQVTPTGSGTVNKTYVSSATVTTGWYENHTVTTTTYTSNLGAVSSFPLPSNTLAPTSAAQQLSFTVNSQVAGSDASGTSAWAVELYDPTGTTQLQVWNGVTTGQVLTYSNSSAVAGAYIWKCVAYCTNNSTGTSSYSDSINFTLGWYDSVTTTTTTYSTTAGTQTSVATAASTVPPTSPSTQLSFNMSSLVAASNSSGSSSWNVTLAAPGNNVVRSWTGLTTAQTLTWFGANAVGGIYTWYFQAVCAVSGSPSATSPYSDTIAGTLTWYQSVTTTNTNYSVFPGTAASYQTDANASAPTSSATQLTLSFSALTLPSSAAGASEYTVVLTDPNGTQVASWIVTSLGQSPLSYSNAGAIAGKYTWTLQATSVMSASPAVVSWSTSLTGSIGWYYAVTSTSTRYINNQSSSTSSAQTDSATLAPTTSALAITLTPSAITLPSSGAGATQYQVTLKDPTGTPVLTQTLMSLTPLSYFNSAARAGQYTWTIYATCTNTGTATASFVTAFSGTIGWHQSLTAPVTTYTVHDGAAARYVTPSNTVAPTGTGTQLTLTLSQVTAPSNSFGSSSVAVVLYDPNNAIVAAAGRTGIVGSTTITYSDAAAIAGSYTWVVYGQCASNNTGTGSYSVSWSGSHSYYQPAPSNQGVYVLAGDGITQRNSVADSDVKFLNLTPSQATFKITNSASSPLAFTLGMQSKGF